MRSTHTHALKDLQRKEAESVEQVQLHHAKARELVWIRREAESVLSVLMARFPFPELSPSIVVL